MTRIAAYICPTRNRPALLRHWLRWIGRTVVPDGWDLRVVVCAPPNDPAVHVVARTNAVLCHAESPWVRDQLNAALRTAVDLGAELILASGDDDLQSPQRLVAAVDAYESGCEVSGVDVLYMFDRATGRVAQWRGPAERAGAFRSYAAGLLTAVGGWPEAERYMDGELTKAIEAHAERKMQVTTLPESVGLTSIATTGPGNMSRERVWPPLGKSQPCGQYTVTGATVNDLDPDALAVLHAMRGGVKVGDIAAALCESIDLDPDLVLQGPRSPIDAEPGDMTWVGEADIEQAILTGATLTIGPRAAASNRPGRVVLGVDNPRRAIAQVIDRLGIRTSPIVVHGQRVTIGSCCSIGGDAYVYNTNPDGTRERFPCVGRVILGDDVEIGDCVAIDRGTVGDTVIGAGTKIDNLVHVGHDARVGRNCLLIAQTMLGGHCQLGDGVTVNPGAKIAKRVIVGDGATIGMGAVVLHDVEPGAVMVGNPARRIR